jgi:hypothetical protein
MSEQSEKKQCDCQREGLAIFPTRYTVVPTYIKSACPTWAKLDGVTTVSLNKDYQYHVRRIRAGFIYIYLPSDADGSNEDSSNEDASSQSESAQEELENRYWLIYSVDDEGRFTKLNGMQSTKSVDVNENGSYHCPNLLSNPTLNAFLTIPNPSRYSKVYIAYSEFPWTVEAMQEYRKTPTPRMQELDIEAWQNKNYNQESATIASERSITDILDFNFDFIQKNALPDTKHEFYQSAQSVNAMQGPLWLYDKKSILLNNDYQKITQINTTEQPWAIFKANTNESEEQLSAEMHDSYVQKLHSTMQSYSGDHGQPMLLALDDAIGVALDLNNYYTDIFGHLGQFNKEADMELDVKEMMKVVETYSEYQVAQEDFEVSPTNDELYLATANGKRLADIDYQEAFSLSQLKDISDKEYESISQYNKHKIGGKFKVRGIIDNMNKIYGTPKAEDGLKAPINRNYYQLVKSYILLVKEYFYGKPLGHEYYYRFMKFLKLNYFGEGPSIYESPWYSDQLINGEYLENSIYAKAIKYSSFSYEAPIEEIKQDAKLLDKVYNALIKEYCDKAKEHQSLLYRKTQNEFKKYKRCLISHHFENVEKKFNQHIKQIASERAKQLINWIKESHYLTFVNDLSYERNIELDNNSAVWGKCQTKIEEELKKAIESKEIEDYQEKELLKINLNGYYFTAVVNRTFEGLEQTEEGNAFIEQLLDIQQFSIEGETYIHIRTSIAALLWRTISYDWQLTWDVLKEIYNAVDANKKEKYAEDALTKAIKSNISTYIVNLRKANLVLEHIMELKKLQNKQGLTTIAIDTSFGKHNIITRWFSNYDNPGTMNNYTLKLYDKLVAMCEPINTCLYSLGAMIAETAALALSGVVWKTAVTYAHMKYQIMATYKVFKAQSFMGVPVGGGLHVLLSTYPAQVKKTLKELRDSLNSAIKQLDKRFTEQFVELDHLFKKQVNVVFKIFSEQATQQLTINQIHLRSARLGFLVGAFEAYNWRYIMNKEPSLFANDTDILLEKAMATSSLAAAVADTVASTILARNPRAIKGFRYAKTGFGVFTALTYFISAVEMGIGAKDNYKYGNSYATWSGGLACGLNTTAGGLYVLYGLSYRYEWVQTLFRVKIQKLILRKGLQQAFNLGACRLLLFRVAGAVGGLAALLTWIYEICKDNDIQIHLKFSALGKKRDEQKFTNAAQQANHFTAIAELKGFFDDTIFSTQQANSAPQTSPKTEDQSDQDQLQHPAIMLQIEQEVLKWLD